MRFSIRDLFWLISIVAICLGWFIDRRAVESSAERQIESAERQMWSAYQTRLAAADAERVAAHEEREHYRELIEFARQREHEERLRPVYYPPKNGDL